MNRNQSTQAPTNPRTRFLAWFFVLVLLAAHSLLAAAAPLRPGAGRFLLFKFQQHIGDERYELRRTGRTLTLHSDFSFTDRGSEVPLTTDAEIEADLTPRSFRFEGKTARLTTIDREIRIQDGRASVRDGQDSREVPAVAPAFAVGGYAPVSVQMLLVRYMLDRHLAAVPVLPQGTVRLQTRGRDRVMVDGKARELKRYSISGLIWGRETVWTDDRGELVAVVGIDAEFDHFEAVRPGYEGALSMLVTSAARDGMLQLAEDSAKVQPPSTDTLAITGATIIDGTGTAPAADATIVIDNGRIAAMGPRAQVAVPSGARVIDARGQYVIPGLWDMHAHFEQVEWGPIYLAAGVTTVRDCGNELEFITAVRDVIRQGKGVGPRLLLAGIIDGPGPRSLGIITADSPNEGRARVRAYKAAGFDQIKVYSSVRLDVLAAIADEAHRQGLTVTGHVPFVLSARDVIAAGQDQINHIQYIRDMLRPADAGSGTAAGASLVPFDSQQARDALALLLDHHIVVDPTMSLMELMTRPPSVDPVSLEPGIAKVAPELAQPLRSFGAEPGQEQQAQQTFKDYASVLGWLHRGGVTIVAGTDQSVPGYSLHRELELYVQAGFTPMEALQSATKIPAEVMGLAADSGTLVVGKRGDLVILAADPLADIRNTRTVRRVVTGGRLYEPAPLWKMVGFQN